VKTYFVYILKCADDSYYAGVTNNLERRLSEHQDGNDPASYTFNKRPVELVFSTFFNDVNQAIQFEKQVKGWTRRKKEALITGKIDKLKEFAQCRNSSSHSNYKKGD
jgi:putative endonuclease